LGTLSTMERWQFVVATVSFLITPTERKVTRKRLKVHHHSCKSLRSTTYSATSTLVAMEDCSFPCQLFRFHPHTPFGLMCSNGTSTFNEICRGAWSQQFPTLAARARI